MCLILEKYNIKLSYTQVIKNGKNKKYNKIMNNKNLNRGIMNTFSATTTRGYLHFTCTSYYILGNKLIIENISII